MGRIRRDCRAASAKRSIGRGSKVPRNHGFRRDSGAEKPCSIGDVSRVFLLGQVRTADPREITVHAGAGVLTRLDASFLLSARSGISSDQACTHLHAPNRAHRDAPPAGRQNSVFSPERLTFPFPLHDFQPLSDSVTRGLHVSLSCSSLGCAVR